MGEIAARKPPAKPATERGAEVSGAEEALRPLLADAKRQVLRAEAALRERTGEADGLRRALRNSEQAIASALATHREAECRLQAIEASWAWRLVGPLHRACLPHSPIGRAVQLAREMASWATSLQFRRQARRRLAKRRVAPLLLRSGLWDERYYRSQRPELLDPRLDAMRHFLLAGAGQGLQPNPLFDPVWYAAQHGGITADDALDHYLTQGMAAGLAPHPLFDPAWYTREVPASCHAPLAYFLRHGKGDPHPLFCAEWYRRRYPEGRDRIPLLHYIDDRGGGDPNPLFDTAWYLRQNPDAAACRTPLEHYLLHPGRKPNPAFDAAWYQRQPGVVGDPLAHYLRHGAAAGLAPFPDFDPAFYLRTNPDATDEGVLAHYLRVGKAARRAISPMQVERRAREQAAVLGLGVPLPPVRLCVGIVTYNNAAPQLRRSIASAQLAARRAGCALSVLLLDNGGPSSLAARDMILADPLPSAGNVGFGAAQNRLMAQGFAQGADVFLALNPDGALHPDSLIALLRMHRAARGCAVIEALQFPDEHPKPHDPLDFETEWASGACLLLPRRIYASIGGFDDRFFMYCEDVDLSWRARAAGFAVKTCAPALLFHPTSGRVVDLETHRRFLSSGLKLAVKWGDEGFAAMVRDRMQGHGLAVPDTSALAGFDAPAGIADFGNAFTFAKARW